MKVLRSSCVLFASSVLFTTIPFAAASPVGLVPANAVWRYLADGTDPGTAWRAAGFDDSSWPSGPAQLGYGEGDEATTVTTSFPAPVTVYFRRPVFIPSGTDLTLRLLRDDGAVVYINGVEVRRDNLPAGEVNSQTLATVSVGGADESTLFESTIPAAMLTPGTNVIAVEVHQNNVNSGDMSFALELIANFGSPGPLVTVTTIDAEAREIPPWLDIPENPAAFQVRRSGSTSNALTVAVRISGTASNGVDYEFIPGAVTIPAGSATAGVEVHAIDDMLAEGTETVVLSIVPTPCPECYVLGTNSTATAHILDNDETNSPPTVWISQPQDGATFRAPADIFLRAVANDREDGYDIAVDFFEGTNRIGAATFNPTLCPAVDCPSWDLLWSNVPPGNYTLTARATDKTGLATVSAPVHISVSSGTNPPPERTVIHVVATDSQASEPAAIGTNSSVLNPGQFAIRRTGNLTSSIPVSFMLGGTAANGTDYAFITNRVVIPAGSTQALVNVTPLSDNLAEGTETVVLTIEPVFCAAVVPTPPECYLVGSPNQVTVFIQDNDGTPTNQPPEVTLHFPQEGEVFTAPADILLRAAARDREDGHEISVEFFAATNRIGAGTFIPSLCPAPWCPSFDLMWSNVPPGSYTLRAKATDSAGAMTISAPVHISVVPDNSSSNRVLVSKGSVWKYLDNGTDQGTAWRSPAYNDSFWPLGPAQLGYGDGDEATVVNGGPTTNRFITTYFRSSFNVSDASAFSNLTVRLLRDDGGVVYLNGVEVFRSNMPTGTVDYLTLALSAAGGADESSNFYSAPINASLLVSGQNVLAVEIHQNSPLSSDMSFDLELLGAGGPQPPEHTVVSVVALDANASETGVLTVIDDGRFAIRRTGNLHAAIPVPFTLSGSAENGVDYLFVTNLVVIPAGSTQAVVQIVPRNDALVEGTETVVLTILQIACAVVGELPPECYDVGSPSSATVFIADAPGGGTNFPIVRVFATDSNATEQASVPPGSAADTGRFTFTRTGGSLTNPLPVYFVFSGTASNSVDYFATNRVVIPPGSSNAHLFIVPIDDAQPEPTETVVVRVVPPPTSPDSRPYQVGSPSTATVLIYDNDTPVGPVSLIPTGSIWKYLDDGTDQGTAWRSTAFDDSTWAAGPAQLGYGDGDEATVVSYGPDPQAKYITTYFRRAFNVSDASAFSNLTVRLLRDDGGVVYLNGVEVFRSNMPAGAVNYLTLALMAAGGDDETSNFYSAPVDPSLLVSGQNVVTVEIHQVNGTSTDISFDLELISAGAGQPVERTVVSVVATDAQATEPVPALPAVNPGQFAIRRTGNFGFSIPVSFVLGGSAANGVDYAFITNRVVIPAGATQTVVNVLPLMDNAVEGTETVILTLQSPICIAIDPPPPECYLVGSPNQATVFITDGPSGTNRAPVAQWVAPSNGSVFTQGMNILLRASAHDSDGSVTRVEFRRSGQIIGSATTPAGTNYTLMWSNPPAGSHTLTAIAVDNLNARGTSAPVNITVREQQSPPDREVHVVAVYSGNVNGGSSRTNETGDASVSVNRPGERVFLVLSAYEPVRWHVTVAADTMIESVLLLGYYHQTVDGLPASVPVVELTGQTGSSSYFYFSPDMNSGSFLVGVQRLCGITGQDITSFQGAYTAPHPAPFVVDSVQDDPRLQCDYPQPVDPSQVPNLSFSLSFNDGYSGNVIWQSYSLTGPSQSGAKLLPAYRVVTNGSGDVFYGADQHRTWRVAGETAQELPLPSHLPELSWPMGITYDPVRQRILVVSLGGEGYLYAYSPASGEWSLVTSMTNRDVDNLAYHAANDSLYAVTVTHGDYGPPKLLRFDANGAFQSELALPQQPFGIGFGYFRSELASVGEYLVLLLETDNYVPYGAKPEARMYLIDPRTGDVWLTYRRVGNADNRIPTVHITSPAEGAQLPPNVATRLAAEASDPDGLVQSVEFFANNTSIGFAQRADNSPAIFHLDWTPAMGAYTLRARATDGHGATAWSIPVTVGVGSNVPPATNFTFRLAFNNREGTEGVFFRRYTLDGPLDGTKLLPTTRVVPDDSGQWHYGAERQEIWRVNLAGGEVQFMEAQIPPHLPEFSWPIGAAFDSIRNRVLVGTLGGEGHLYAYSTASTQWSLVNDLDNHDLDCIVHHAADDSIYAVEPRYSASPRLVKFDANGEYVSEIPLPPQMFEIGGAAMSSSELVSIGEYLVLLIEPNPNWHYNQSGLESRIYLIDPRTGQVRLTYSRAVPPDSDLDGDGVADDRDQCAETPAGAIVDAQGCSLAQLCPCDGPWPNHADYVRGVIAHAWSFYRQGLITESERRLIIGEATRSNCGTNDGLRVHLQPQTPQEIRAGGLCLVLSGDVAGACVLECSTDLVHWTPIQTRQMPCPEMEMIDLEASQAPPRFYRVRLGP